MAKSKIIKAVKFLEQCLKESNLNISKVILFGSHANGRPTGDSDIDVVIVSDNFDGKDIFERASLTKDAEIRTIKRFMLPLDIITLSSKEWRNGESLVVHYADDGEVVYG